MPKKEELLVSLDWVSQRISDRVWTIAVGVVASSLTFIIESTKTTGSPFLQPKQVALPAGLALLALLCDLTQYVAAYRQNQKLLRYMEKEGVKSAQFPVDDKYRRIRVFSYNAKFWLCVVAVGWIVLLCAIRTFELTI